MTEKAIYLSYTGIYFFNDIVAFKYSIYCIHPNFVFFIPVRIFFDLITVFENQQKMSHFHAQFVFLFVFEFSGQT